MQMMLNPSWSLLVTPEEIAPVASRYAPAPTQFANGYSLLKERLFPGAKVLEFGCGPGDLGYDVADQTSSDYAHRFPELGIAHSDCVNRDCPDRGERGGPLEQPGRNVNALSVDRPPEARGAASDQRCGQ